MAKKVRAFLAIETPPEIRTALSRVVKKLDKSEAVVNWVEGESLHLTLKFLGEIAITDVAEIYLRLKRDLAGIEPFEVSVNGLGAFPDVARPRTLWAGVSTGAEEAGVLFDRMEESMLALGFRREARRFSPHLTIGRVKELTPALSELLTEHAGFAGGPMDVEEVVLFSSELTRSGPIYEPLARIPLGAGT